MKVGNFSSVLVLVNGVSNIKSHFEAKNKDIDIKNSVEKI